MCEASISSVGLIIRHGLIRTHRLRDPFAPQSGPCECAMADLSFLFGATLIESESRVLEKDAKMFPEEASRTSPPGWSGGPLTWKDLPVASATQVVTRRPDTPESCVEASLFFACGIIEPPNPGK